MNYAAVNLSFRGFEQAETAYREALRLRPNEFEAHLGLALAIRGQITPGNRDEKMPEAEKQLAEAKKLSPNRPETYYNEAILTQEFKAKSAGDEDKSIAMMKVAIRQYEDFTSKAGGDSAFTDAVKRSNERIKDMRDTIKFLEEGKKSREEAARAAKVAPPPPPPGDKDKDSDKGAKGGASEPESKGDDMAKDKKSPADAKKSGADEKKSGTDSKKAPDASKK